MQQHFAERLGLDPLLTGCSEEGIQTKSLSKMLLHPLEAKSAKAFSISLPNLVSPFKPSN
jgi:hypothetical protein